MKNQLIKNYLESQRDNSINHFESYSNIHELFNEVYNDLKQFDWKKYSENLKVEIKNDLKEWWTNPDKGIDKDEELYAIYFEYDFIFCKDAYADSYGIGTWKDFKVETQKFSMGYDHDFSTGFEALRGPTLNFFDSLEKLYKNLPSGLQSEGMFHLDGHEELVNSFKFTAFCVMHEVFKTLDEIKLFEQINYKKGFMFLIGEHDMGEIYPLYIKE